MGRHDREIGELLRFAAGMVPAEVQSEDVLDHLDHEEWELVLELLGEFDGNTWQTPRYWALLAEAATQMDVDGAWFQWRCVESIQGVLRVELVLELDAEPLQARGERPAWDVTGNHRRVAALWIESKPVLGPGERATARLRPFVPPAWTHLIRGDLITLLGSSPGTAKIIEKVPPRP
ncbi:hypothetical protein SK803_42185 [Lentzea sp. BCCO 10_0856]|uniref:Uncharacterized protein n=1 Tax=Lentzea miocenica TaxID=3095431 RepID=A0ABU4TF78_9PSEU|nr:hypothetical protein [Lentzea sp. BCCO 10_0856]MDX8036845.1 hypothetical protein [Lentzea sp. BCCO 10_0856]